jgi:glyoxylate/hydroxypyruvate reductase
MADSGVEVAIIATVADEALSRIAAVDGRVRVADARGWFDGEIRETWPRWTVERYVGRRPGEAATREQRDRLLARAEVVVGGWPFPLDLRARAARMRWFHQLPAGASNLLRGDLWASDVVVTTSRGYGNTRAMAEYVLAGFLHFARGFDIAGRDQQHRRFERRGYRPVLIQDKTVCVVGVGGIGRAVGELCAGAGMRAVGTRRHVEAGGPMPTGFARLDGASRLHELLAESDYIAVCCQWTPETTKLIGRAAFAAMKPGVILVNVARGEIIDETALAEALEAGTVGGAALDVYEGEFEHEPDRRLWDHERVVITPHVSGGGDIQQHRGVELFCENLRAYLNGRPLINVIDWARGY